MTRKVTVANNTQRVGADTSFKATWFFEAGRNFLYGTLPSCIPGSKEWDH